MSLLTLLIIGGLVGYIAGKVMGREEGVLMSIVVGIVGSFIGSLVSTLFTGADRAYLDFSWMGVAWSFVGAITLMAILNAVSGKQHHHSA